jgi:hypothetical protein
MTSDEGSNVVAFTSRPRQQEPEPELKFVEQRLDPQTCAIEMTVVDERGDTFVLKYPPPRVPEGFRLARLAEAWDGWRGSSAAAS